MKEFFGLVLALIIVGGIVTGYNGIANSVRFHYMCGVDIPWYASLFLDVNQCPAFGGQKAG